MDQAVLKWIQFVCCYFGHKLAGGWGVGDAAPPLLFQHHGVPCDCGPYTVLPSLQLGDLGPVWREWLRPCPGRGIIKSFRAEWMTPSDWHSVGSHGNQRFCPPCLSYAHVFLPRCHQMAERGWGTAEPVPCVSAPQGWLYFLTIQVI